MKKTPEEIDREQQELEEELDSQEKERETQKKKQGWQEGVKQAQLPVEGQLDQKKLTAILDEREIEYKITKEGVKCGPEGKEMYFNLQTNQITLPDTSAKSFETAAELTAKAGGKGWDLGPLSEQVEGMKKTPDEKLQILTDAYSAAKKEGLTVTGLSEKNAAKIEAKIASEMKPELKGGS